MVHEAGSEVAVWTWLSWLAVRASCASKLAWLAVPWCERSLMAPTVRAVWWWSVQVAHNAHHQHHQGGQAQYGRVVVASATRKSNDGFIHGKPVVL